MTITLSNEEKTQIVESHKKNLMINRYNAFLTKIEENAKSSPDSATVASLNSQIAVIDAQIAALDEELATFSE